MQLHSVVTGGQGSHGVRGDKEQVSVAHTVFLLLSCGTETNPLSRRLNYLICETGITFLLPLKDCRENKRDDVSENPLQIIMFQANAVRPAPPRLGDQATPTQ